MKNSYFFGLLLVSLVACQAPDSSTKNAPKAETPETVASPETPATTAPETTEATNLTGVDVSHFQGEINWEELKGAGIQFVFIKATEGLTDLDPDFLTNRKGATDAGIIRGAYHFFIATDDPVKQAEHFISKYGEMVSGDLAPVLDLEEGGFEGKTAPADYAQRALLWLQTIQKHYNVTPTVYISPDFANEYCTDASFANYRLWLAQYGVEKPTLPEAWKSSHWTFWQRAESGSITGISGNVDHDLFNGSMDELKQLSK